MSETSYKQRDLESLGKHYGKHVQAMMVEGLHSKSAIAAELAYRDVKIELMTKHRDEWAKDKFEILGNVRDWEDTKRELELEIVRLKEASNDCIT